MRMSGLHVRIYWNFGKGTFEWAIITWNQGVFLREARKFWAKIRVDKQNAYCGRHCARVSGLIHPLYIFVGMDPPKMLGLTSYLLCTVSNSCISIALLHMYISHINSYTYPGCAIPDFENLELGTAGIPKKQAKGSWVLNFSWSFYFFH